MKEVTHYRAIYQNEIKELKRKLLTKELTANDLLMKTTSNYNSSNKYTKTVNTNLLTKKSDMNLNGNNINNNENLNDDYYFKTALNAGNKRLENEIEILKKKLEEKDTKDKKKRNKIYNQGNLLMTKKIFDEFEKAKNRINKSYKNYEEKIKFSLNNYENSEYKNKIMDDSVRTFFYEVLKEIDSIEKKIENWKFNIQRNIGGMDYAMKNN